MSKLSLQLGAGSEENWRFIYRNYLVTKIIEISRIEILIMKNLFVGYHRLSGEEFSKLWETALFVPDTSFLLTLYRLPANPREKMFEALRAVENRLWVPHNVILEYMRNRPTVIADQKIKFNEVRKIISESHKKLIDQLSNLKLEKRHSLIDIKPFEDKLDEIIKGFYNEIFELEKNHITYENDDLFDAIFLLFNNKIGTPPQDQEEIDTIYKEAEKRFSKKIPPGYMDIDKSKDKASSSYEYGGINYQRQYGDYLIWSQLIKHAADNKIKSVIFITDDTKEDWFWTINKQKIGPRPELVEEIKRLGGIELFYIYSTEKFMEYANSYLGLNIEHAALKAIKDITEFFREEDDQLQLAAKDPKEIVETIVQDFSWDLINSDEIITGATAETNAFGWGLDVYEIIDAEYDEKNKSIYFNAILTFYGEQDDDKPFCGDQLTVELSGTIEYSGDSFQLAGYGIDSCKSNVI